MFLSFLTKPGATFWPPKDPDMEFLKQTFNFQSIIKTEAIILSSMWLKDWLTKVKSSKIVTFCSLTQNGQKLHPNFPQLRPWHDVRAIARACAVTRTNQEKGGLACPRLNLHELILSAANAKKFVQNLFRLI